MMFDAHRTDNPKMEGSRGQHPIFSTHFQMDESGKLRLNTVGHGKMDDRTRQTIQVVPSTSPFVGDMHDNSSIDESLPNRFDFLERRNPEEGTETEPQPQTFSPQEKDYSHLPPAYREAARLADEQKNASEPMDIAMRLLKGMVI